MEKVNIDIDSLFDENCIRTSSMMGAIQSAIDHNPERCMIGVHFCLSWVGLSSIDDRLRTLATVVENLSKHDNKAARILFASVSAVIATTLNKTKEL